MGTAFSYLEIKPSMVATSEEWVLIDFFVFRANSPSPQTTRYALSCPESLFTAKEIGASANSGSDGELDNLYRRRRVV